MPSAFRKAKSRVVSRSGRFGVQRIGRRPGQVSLLNKGVPAQLEAEHAFAEHELNLSRVVADGLEWSCCWSASVAQCLLFVLDFAYGTGLPPSTFSDRTAAALGYAARRPTLLRGRCERTHNP
jgi:hypothetical protein